MPQYRYRIAASPDTRSDVVRERRPGAVAIGLVGLATAAGLAACGGGSSGKVSSAALEDRLLPASSVPGYRQQRTFDWSDSVNLVGEGLVLPESTHPSEGVKTFHDAGLKGAAGERFAQGKPPDESYLTIGVLKLKSAKAARKARDWMHGQDLLQPCFSACIFSPRNLRIPGVPTATAVQQTPTLSPPGVKSLRPGAKAVPPPGVQGPPTHYLVEFTTGRYLYFFNGDGSRRDARKVVTTTQGYYRGVRKLGG
jgi:hypothetical protein